MAYNVSDLRLLVRTYARNAFASSMYTDTDIDNALQVAGDRWMRITKAFRSLDTVTLSVGSTAITAPTAWLPRYHLQCYVTLSGQILPPDIKLVPYDEVLARQYGIGGTIINARPTMMGFPSSSNANGILDASPDQAYVFNFWYWQPFTTWVAGGTPSPNAFNLTDEQLRVVATIGAPAELQKNEPENAARCKDMLAEFLKEASNFKSQDIGGRLGTTLLRDCPDNYPNWSTWIPRG